MYWSSNRNINFLINDVEITGIHTSAVIIYPRIWWIMEKMGFKCIGTRMSTYFNDYKNLESKVSYGIKELFMNRDK